jgi:hypothetical protein
MFLRNLRLDLMDYWVFDTFVFEIEQFIGLMISNNLLGKCLIDIFFTKDSFRFS